MPSRPTCLGSSAAPLTNAVPLQLVHADSLLVAMSRVASEAMALQGRGRVEIALDGRPAATAWQGLDFVVSQRHSCVSTIILHPLTGAPPTHVWDGQQRGAQGLPSSSWVHMPCCERPNVTIV